MKKTLFFFLILVLVMCFSTHVIPQVTENTAVGAMILSPLSITEDLPMHFGSMGVLAVTGGTCVLSTAGVRSATSGVTLSALAPLMSLATYTVTGEPSYTYAITLPNTITVTNTTGAGGETMSIDNLLAKSTSGTESHAATGTLEAGGAEKFKIGGTLNVIAAQVSGIYSGTFYVTVAYN